MSITQLEAVQRFIASFEGDAEAIAALVVKSKAQQVVQLKTFLLEQKAEAQAKLDGLDAYVIAVTAGLTQEIADLQTVHDSF